MVDGRNLYVHTCVCVCGGQTNPVTILHVSPCLLCQSCSRSQLKIMMASQHSSLRESHNKTAQVQDVVIVFFPHGQTPQPTYTLTCYQCKLYLAVRRCTLNSVMENWKGQKNQKIKVINMIYWNQNYSFFKNTHAAAILKNLQPTVCRPHTVFLRLTAWFSTCTVDFMQAERREETHDTHEDTRHVASRQVGSSGPTSGHATTSARQDPFYCSVSK